MQPARTSKSTHPLVDVGRTVGAYARGQLIVAGILTVIYALGFYLIGVPLWPLAAFLCGLLNLIPLVGTLIGAVIPVLFLLLGGGHWAPVVQVLVLFFAAQALESLYLSPKILGTQLQLRPLVVFVVVLLGGLLFGPLGALVAAPVTATALLMRRRWKASRRGGGDSGQGLHASSGAQGAAGKPQSFEADKTKQSS